MPAAAYGVASLPVASAVPGAERPPIDTQPLLHGALHVELGRHRHAASSPCILPTSGAPWLESGGLPQSSLRSHRYGELPPSPSAANQRWGGCPSSPLLDPCHSGQIDNMVVATASSGRAARVCSCVVLSRLAADSR
ncbi:hypothetical protein BDA96_10G036000 [Sorghum bicolor]|uniref:Uncharacterized protein n=1 Tax=Sorghum bicolor TaxID=4558 RepID=A0A921TZV7_SORBI|nr:hypothetical protein BDA96_10G036000 [Sorghum bicolor]